MSLAIQIDRAKIAEFCRKWRITEFSLFGSVLRDDFRPDSDVDVMVSFTPEAGWSLLDLARMEQELETLFDRPVDLVERSGIERSRNPFRKRSVLASAERLL
jgi:predicted nucleotidyltransferase